MSHSFNAYILMHGRQRTQWWAASYQQATSSSFPCNFKEHRCRNHQWWATVTVHERHVIETYFWDGFRYASIVRFLKEYHDINMCVQALWRHPRRYVTGVWIAWHEVIDALWKLMNQLWSKNKVREGVYFSCVSCCMSQHSTLLV